MIELNVVGLSESITAPSTARKLLIFDLRGVGAQGLPVGWSLQYGQRFSILLYSMSHIQNILFLFLIDPLPFSSSSSAFPQLQHWEQ